tara:strand:- start:4080 stop:4610 length:531 start_codon:yes stop_codon:yes gene_type:complete
MDVLEGRAQENVHSYAYCSICLGVNDGAPWIALYHCGHLFHQCCIDECENQACPLCKTPFQSTNVRAIFLDGVVDLHAHNHQFGEGDIILVLREIAEQDGFNGHGPLLEKLLRCVGIYAITHAELDVSLIGMDPLLYKSVMRAFELGQRIQQRGTDLPLGLVNWKSGILECGPKPY